MRQFTISIATVSIATVVALALSPFALSAQTDPDKPAGKLKFGKVEGDVQYSKLTPSQWHFTGHIKVTSDAYDLAAEDLKMYFLPGKGGKISLSTLEKATADGDAQHQVEARIEQPLEKISAYEILSDHAVYTPDNSRPGGGQMIFTGHVVVNSHSGFLVGPATGTMEKATVLLGTGSEYPQLETGPAHFVATPAQ